MLEDGVLNMGEPVSGGDKAMEKTMTEDIAEVSRLAANLPTLQPLGNGPGEVTEYLAENGFCVGFYLYRRDGPRGYATQRTLVSAGMRLPRHAHGETQAIVLCYGKARVEYDDGREPDILEGPAVHLIGPWVPHSIVAIESCEFVGTTIPASPEYPRRDNGRAWKPQ